MKLERFDIEITLLRTTEIKGRVEVLAESYEDAVILAKYAQPAWDFNGASEKPECRQYRQIHKEP